MIEHDVAYGLERAIELAPNDGCPITLTIGECESLIIRLRQAEKDAARYRFMRDSGKFKEIGEEFDAAVDKAMKILGCIE